ncbi:CPBP family intramembrane glutamic endopeptidase [Gimesia aquarii]|uniref:CAAX amino terminal protease self-immunity n=1 Tax=Gimesia aquarii TaxID=2527964 RepID=A0A517X0W5_9PLAN|nr:CPBP family intramembrane glutamic endopeptidase [Gimesia aquarii]QDU11141.1 CAAX amino terminal protease self- immunity [Gimesia aquarii]
MTDSENTPADESESKKTNLAQNNVPESNNQSPESQDFSEVVEQVVNDEEEQIVWLADDQAAPDLETPVKVHPPGPGLLESIGWMFGVIGAHFAGGLVFIVGVFVYLITTSKVGPKPQEISNQFKQFLEDHVLELAGVEQGVFVLIVMAAVGLRLGRGTFAKLNLQPFAFSTGLLFFITVLPLSLISGELYRVTFDVWSLFADQWPVLKQFDEMNTMEAVKQMAENSPLWALVIVIAVFPAIGEELVFRGAIGHGLLARWGLIPGILITSIMFGMVHAHPAHIVAVIPLGMFMHYVYYVTRSFWAPILVHFLNNAFAVSMAKLATSLPEEAAKLGDETQAVHPMITLSASLFIAVVCFYLWKTRSQYRKENGEVWTPGYVSNESPPPDTSITLQRDKITYGIYYYMAALFLVFLGMVQIFGIE